MAKKFGPSSLLDYEAKELSFIKEHSSGVVSRGYIDSWTELYPEISPDRSTGFDRGGVPLTALLLLYERVALYIPPSSPKLLEERWGMPLNLVFELCEAGLVQPIVGHPTDYVSRHFEPLFAIGPPSVWARGLGLLDSLGMGEKLEEALHVLPVSEICMLPWVREHWKEHFPTLTKDALTAAIQREIQTLYADLWVFGDELVALALSHLKDPDEIARKLRLVNEVRTYPTLFGLGGTTHYNSEFVKKEPILLDRIERPGLVLPPELDLLAKGMGIDIRSMSVREIADFHASDIGRSLRRALQEFEHEVLTMLPGDLNRDNLLVKVIAFEERLSEARKVLADPKSLRAMKNTGTRVRGLLRFGGLALGALAGEYLGASWVQMLGSAGFGLAIVEKLLPERYEEAITRTSIAQRFSPGIAHLWQALSKR